jgi:zinc transporter
MSHLESPGAAWILVFDDLGRAALGSTENVAPGTPAGGEFVWGHFVVADTRFSAICAKFAWLTADARLVLTQATCNQFVNFSGDLVYGAIFDHEIGLDGVSSDTDFLRFVVGRNFLITSRRRPLQAASRLREQVMAGRVFSSSRELFAAIVEQIFTCMSDINLLTSAVLDEIEDVLVVRGEGRSQRSKLGKTRREIVSLLRQTTGLTRTMRHYEEIVEAIDLGDVRPVIRRLVQSAEALQHDVSDTQDRARMLQDEVNALVAIETNDRLFLLTVITTLILPATLVTGFFGMNTKGLPFADAEYAALYAGLFCMAASMAALRFLRRSGITGKD